MLLEALEILQSAGQEEDSFVTDFGIYKVTYILTVYLPLMLATFLLSQEYLGAKIACFAPEKFTDSDAQTLNEYCWNNGFWVSEAVPRVKSLYTQPHRFYPLYLPVQAVLFTSPIVLWNICTKSHLLAVLRATEEFLEELLELVQKSGEESAAVATKAKGLMRQFHKTCVQAAQKSSLSKIGIARVTWETLILIITICLQFFIYNHREKTYDCRVSEPDLLPARDHGSIVCTVPILDLLDTVWSINAAALTLALALNLYMVFRLYQMHFSQFQPLFYNSLPYGDTDDFNEQVSWDSRWTKDSYRLLTRIFLENQAVMTKAYVLMALKPDSYEETSSVTTSVKEIINDTEDSDESSSLLIHNAKTRKVDQTLNTDYEKTDDFFQTRSNRIDEFKQTDAKNEETCTDAPVSAEFIISKKHSDLFHSDVTGGIKMQGSNERYNDIDCLLGGTVLQEVRTPESTLHGSSVNGLCFKRKYTGGETIILPTNRRSISGDIRNQFESQVILDGTDDTELRHRRVIDTLKA